MNPALETILMDGRQTRQQAQASKSRTKTAKIDFIAKATTDSPAAYLNAAGKLADSQDPNDQAERRAYATKAMIAAEQMGVREAWHLHSIGLSPAIWAAKTGQTYEATRALHDIETLAARRRAGNEIRWNDPALIRARINTTAAAERHGLTQMKPKHLRTVLGISHFDWIEATGSLFRRVKGGFRDIGAAIVNGKETPIRSFYVTKPIKTGPESAYG